jgi:hypothetical protein
MRGLLIAVMSLTLAATGFAQSRYARGGFTGGFNRGFVSSNRALVGAGRAYPGRYYGGYGYGYGVGLGYSAFRAPYCYGPYYGAYGCGYAPYGYYAPPVPRAVVPYGVIAPRPAVIVGGGWRRFGRR